MQWLAREECWLQTKVVGLMEAEVEFIMPSEAARKWAYLRANVPPRDLTSNLLICYSTKEHTMNLFMSDAAAIKRVQSLGLRVVNPANPPDLAEAQRTLLSNGFYVAGPSDPPDLARARKMLEAAGMRVMANHRRIPAAGWRLGADTCLKAPVNIH